MKVDYRTIRKKTECTEEQAKYLAEEIRKLPKLKEQIMDHLDEVNLYNCHTVKLVRCFGYEDTACNIIGYRPDPRFNTISVDNHYKFGFDIIFKDEVFKSVY